MADILEAELAHVPVGAQVPSEHVLADRFHVSRPAARAALQELERRLLVRRVQGVGTFRRGRVEYVISAHVPPSFSETVRLAGAEPGARLVSCGARRAVEQERSRLGLSAGAAVWSVERVFSVNGEVAAYATSVLPRRPLLNLDRSWATRSPCTRSCAAATGSTSSVPATGSASTCPRRASPST
ncbi:GntR family transcriptional regulator [Nonomuraea antimicrobica]